MPNRNGVWLYLGKFTGIPVSNSSFPTTAQARSLQGFTSSAAQNPSYPANNSLLAIVDVTWTVDSSDAARVNNAGGTTSVGTYNLGNGNVTSRMNYTANYRVEFILANGTRVEDGISIVQYENGDIFVRPSATMKTELTTLEWPISGIRIVSHVPTTGGQAGFASFGGPRTFATTTGEVPELVPCFTAGTLIRTARGAIPVETLKAGDMIHTLDNGLQPLKWIGMRRLVVTATSAPIVIAAGTLGNSRDLRVSPAHRMLVTGWKAEMLFGTRDILVAASDLVNGDSIYADTSAASVDYVHLMFDRHQIVFAEGAPSESLFISTESMDLVTLTQREEIFTIFPELRLNPAAYGASARRIMHRREALALN